MIDRLKTATLFALYQLTVAVGIVLLPVAMILARAGVVLPVHRAVDALEAALEDASTTA